MKKIFSVILLLGSVHASADTVAPSNIIKLKDGEKVTLTPIRQTTVVCETVKPSCKIETNSTGIYISYDGIKISENFETGAAAKKELTKLQKAGSCK